jgi:hypothetical protein
LWVDIFYERFATLSNAFGTNESDGHTRLEPNDTRDLAMRNAEPHWKSEVQIPGYHSSRLICAGSDLWPRVQAFEERSRTKMSRVSGRRES